MSVYSECFSIFYQWQRSKFSSLKFTYNVYNVSLWYHGVRSPTEKPVQCTLTLMSDNWNCLPVYTYDVVFATYQRKATDSTKVDTPRQKASRCCENSKKIYSEWSISPLSDYSLPVRPTNSEYSVASFYIGVYTVVTVLYSTIRKKGTQSSVQAFAS